MDADEQRGRPPASRPTPLDIFLGTGDDISRILALSDGVFAFARTLLVLTLTVPAFDPTLTADQASRALWGYLWSPAGYRPFLGYLFAFLMIAIWWMAQHRTFRYIERYDRTLVWLNLFLLLEIAVMPFVVEIYTRYYETPTAVALFATSQIVAGVLVNGIWMYAANGHRLVRSDLDDKLIGTTRAWGWVAPVLFLGSIGVTFLSVDAAQYAWAGVFVIQRLGRRYLMR